jgi:paraquat-inducible protein B
MEAYLCPLCKQQVSQAIFEKITGIWDEKEKRLKALRKKEADLKKREQDLIKKFNDDKKKLAASLDTKFRASLDLKIQAIKKSAQKEQEKLRREKIALERDFKNKITAETNRVLRQEKIRQQHVMADLRGQLERQAAEKIEKSNKALQKDKGRFERSKSRQIDTTS